MAEKSVVRTEAAPAPFQGAPYSQAILAHGFVFVAGQVGMRPGGTEVAGDSIEEQTEQVFQNLKAILEAAGSSLEHVVKTTVFLRHISDFPAMNAAYAEVFGEHRPARSTLGVAGLPLGALVEVEAWAYVG